MLHHLNKRALRSCVTRFDMGRLLRWVVMFVLWRTPSSPFVLRRNLHSLALFTLVWFLFILLSACESASETELAPANIEVTSTAPDFTFGIIYSLAHPFYEIVTEGAEQAARTAGGRMLIKAPDEANLERQIRMIEDMIRQQVDGIAISPIDSEGLAPYINKAIEAGIPVICFESDAPLSSRISFIGGDNERAGWMMAEALQAIMGNEGMVLVESGMPTMKSHEERLNGFIDYIRENTNIQVLEVRSHNGSGEQALSEIEQMIDAHPHFDAFISLDYVSGTNAILAWKAMGLKRYALTIGMMPAIEEAIVNGQISLALSQNEAVWGQQIVEVLLRLMQGESVPEVIHTGDRIIDAASVEVARSGEGSDG